jgi:hypothetical protein
MEAMLKEVDDLITMEAVLYMLLLTSPIGKEWFAMKAVRFARALHDFCAPPPIYL